MLRLLGSQLGHRFAGHWLFRQLAFDVPPGGSLAVLGPNGSGKSTVLRMLAGQLAPVEGALQHLTAAGTPVAPEDIYRQVCWASPAVEPYTALTLIEALELHFSFRRCRHPKCNTGVMEAIGLQSHAHKPLRQFSSGMLQRVKLALALYSEGALLLLDEPTANLDETGSAAMLALIRQEQAGRTLVLASNLAREYADIPLRIHIAPPSA